MVPILSVPLNAMCSNIWARPVWPMGSCTEPASTWVLNEKTGASGTLADDDGQAVVQLLDRDSLFKSSQILREATAESIRSSATDLSARYFIGPPQRLDRT